MVIISYQHISLILVFKNSKAGKMNFFLYKDHAILISEWVWLCQGFIQPSLVRKCLLHKIMLYNIQVINRL